MARVRPAFTLLLAVGATSCTASLDLGRFHKDDASSVDTAIAVTYYDVHFKARAMTPHINERLELRIVDKNEHLQAKAVYEDVVSPEFSLYLRRVVPKANAPYRLDFWADHNLSGAYDGIVGGVREKDHAWRRVLADPLPEDMRLVQGTYVFDFLHDTAFVDIATDLLGNKIPMTDTLLPFTLNVTGGAAYASKTVDVRVVDKASGRLVGLHRRPSRGDAWAARIDGIVDEETAYAVSVYVDQDGDGKYGPADPSWQLDLVSGSDALVGALDLGAAPRSPIETGEP